MVLSSGGYSPFVYTSNGQIIVSNTVDANKALLNSDIFSVINRVSSDVASCNVNATNPLVEKYIKQPRPTMSGYNLWQSVVAQLMLAGNAYVLIHRDNRGAISGLEQIPLEQVTVILNSDSSAINYTVCFEDERPEQTFNQSDMLHFRLFVSGQACTQLVGVSPLDSLVNEVAIQDNSKRLSLNMLTNAIAPSYVLTVPKGRISPEAKEDIRQSFEKQNAQGANGGRTIVLDQSLQLSPLQINPDLAKMINDLNFTQNQIAKAFCIPAAMLNGASDQQSSIEMLNQQYLGSLRLYIQPLISEMELKLGCDIHYDTRPVTDPQNDDLVSNIAKLGTARNPVITAEQAQEILDKTHVFPMHLEPTPVQVDPSKGGE